MANSFDDLRELAKTSLSAYAAVMHHDWAPNWHHRVIARALERMAAREPGWDRLIISMPPRAGKSELISKMFPGWYMATHPHENVIVATYGSELADDLGRKAREYASTELFESIMGTSVSNDTNAITKWELKNRSSFFATSVGGALTGRGAHCFVKGTRVRVIGGTIPIEEIEVGDSVLSHGADGLEMRDVVAVKRSKGVGIYRITTASGRVVEATGDHPFFVQGEGYIPASLLTSGDMLLCCVREGSDYQRRSFCIEREAGVCESILQQGMLYDGNKQGESSEAISKGRTPGENGFMRYLRGRGVSYMAAVYEFVREVLQQGVPQRGEKTGCCEQRETRSYTNAVRDLWRNLLVKLETSAGAVRQVLLPKLSLCGTDSYQERGEQPYVQGRGQSTEETTQREKFQSDAATSNRFGWRQVCGLFTSAFRAPNGIARTSHRQEPTEQFSAELSGIVQSLPQEGTPSDRLWEGHDYVRMVERVRETETVYDIQVEGNHNFFANDILVHNCLIIDDPVKNREEAESEGAMEKTYSWFTSTAYTRLERGGRVLIVMTRWNDLDLAGRLLASNSGWKEIAFPAIAEVDEEYRKAGEPLWPDKYPLEQLHKIRTTIGRRDWASLYQQRPAPEDGNIFKSEWFKEYRLPNGMVPSTHNDIYSQAGLSGLGVVSGVYQSWDTAVSAKQTSARSACTTWAVLDNKFYLLDAYAEPLSFPELRAKAMQKYEQWKPDIIFVEEQQTGRPLIDELKRTLGERLVPVRLRGNKETRAKAASVAFETGRVLIPSPQDAPWVDSYTNELMSFPSGRFADRVDSTSQALVKLLKDSNPRSSFKGAMSDLAENYFKAPLRSIYAR